VDHPRFIELREDISSLEEAFAISILEPMLLYIRHHSYGYENLNDGRGYSFLHGYLWQIG
jgi:hypothetical protein